METDALTTYFIQQRQLAWLILGGGILAIVFGGVGIILGQTLFVRGLGIGMVIKGCINVMSTGTNITQCRVRVM